MVGLLLRILSVALTAVLAITCSSGGDTAKGRALADGCLLNSDCQEPLVCAFRRCHTECNTSRDCPEDQRCVASDRPFFVCQLATERSCSVNAQCPLRMVCGADGECRDQCVTASDCIPGQLCVSGTCADHTELDAGRLPTVPDAGGTSGTVPCVYPSDCPTGLTCRNGACLVECREDRDCPYLAVCAAGRCEGAGLPGAGGAGSGGGSGTGGVGTGGATAACVLNSDCPVGELCAGGECHCECRADRDCAPGDRCGGCGCVAAPAPDASAGTGGMSGSGGGGGAGGVIGSGGVTGSGGATASGGGGGTAGTGGSAGAGGASGSGGSPATGGATGTGGAGGVVVNPIDCSSRDPSGATQVSGAITTPQTWSGLVHVTGNVYVRDDATLTIDPGTLVLVSTGARIEIGYASTGATLIAAGTEDAPIAFCGITATPGAWGGINVGSTVSTASVLTHVLVSDGGTTDAALAVRSGVLVSDVQVRNSGSDGVWAWDFKPGSVALTVEGSVGSALSLQTGEAITRFPRGGKIAGNGADVALAPFTSLGATTVFHDIGVPYVRDGALFASTSGTVTFEAGVTVRLGAGATWYLGYNGGGTTIQVDGTPERPVVFEGRTAAPGAWGGLAFDASVTSTSYLRNVRVRHAGSGGKPAIDLRARVTFDGVVLDQNETGMSVDAQGFGVGSKGLTIGGTTGSPLTIHPNVLPTLPVGGTFTGNGQDRIVVTGGSYSKQGVAPAPGVPYFIQDDVLLLDYGSLELSPGTEIIADTNVLIDVGWNGNTATFRAVGTAALPVVFRGLDPAAGSWRGLAFRSSAISTSALDHVEVHDAGRTGSAALELAKEIAVTNSTITGSTGYAIRHPAAFATDYSLTNTLSGNTQGTVSKY